MSFEPPPEEEPPPEDGWIPSEGHQAPTGPAEPASTPDATEEFGGAEAIADILERLGNVEEIAAYSYEELTNYPAGGPWFWKELNLEKRRELWVELGEFVTWLQNRILCHWSNTEGSIAPCWYLHPDAVELLTALMVAHKAAYRAKSKKPSFELTEWFTRALWPTLEALARRSTFKNCLSEREHRPSSGGIVLDGASTAFRDFITEATTAPAAAAVPSQSREGDTDA
ncbi:hypothetical protein [Arthrobacter antibioticus]|uniref:hypothetical protein n=1 Tax=Arthrobacter sp. H35-MC1 TaxID=3046203 RepID=UPI0024BB73A8|nr:hypothetical protein [Arthrobacter sp. H35-MC1]MDJ0318880.1 hypothetical protein [Arthrobacter sp. H35-MC1]